MRLTWRRDASKLGSDGKVGVGFGNSLARYNGGDARADGATTGALYKPPFGG